MGELIISRIANNKDLIPERSIVSKRPVSPWEIRWLKLANTNRNLELLLTT